MERTEGWAVGLRLAALTLQRCTDDADRARAVADFAGDNRAVADYLVAEVLDRLPEDLRRFLLQTSVAERVDAGLAEHLTGTSGGGGGPGAAGDRRRTAWSRSTTTAAGTATTGSSRSCAVSGCTPRTRSLVAGLHTRAAFWFAEHGEYDEASAPGPGGSRLVGLRPHRGGAAPARTSSGTPAARCAACSPSCPPDVEPDDPWLATVRALELHDTGVPDRLAQRVARAEELWAGRRGRRRAPPRDGARAAPGRGCPQPLRRRPGRGRVRGGAGPGRLRRRRSGRVLAGAPVVPRLRRPAPGQEPGLAGSPGGGRDLPAPGRLVELRRPARPGRRWPAGAAPTSRWSLRCAARSGRRRPTRERALPSAVPQGWADEIQSTSAWLSLALVHLQRGRLRCRASRARRGDPGPGATTRRSARGLPLPGDRPPARRERRPGGRPVGAGRGSPDARDAARRARS